jgi:hypothetical protein
VADGCIGALLPEAEAEAPLVRPMLRELLAACMLRPAMMYLTPPCINKLLLQVGGVAAAQLALAELPAASRWQPLLAGGWVSWVAQGILVACSTPWNALPPPCIRLPPGISKATGHLAAGLPRRGRVREQG